MKVYISGPMTGIEEFNYPAFNDATEALRDLGVDVVNPVEINPDGHNKTWQECLKADVKGLCDCDTICLLPGWEDSPGAHLELHLAHRFGFRVISFDCLVNEAMNHIIKDN